MRSSRYFSRRSMTDNREDRLGADPNEVADDDLAAIYGTSAERAAEPLTLNERIRTFKPWHHPVKQVVRARQWAALTARLIDERAVPNDVLRYFTLPGADLLDVRVLAEVCAQRGVKIQYFGFDAGADEAEERGPGERSAAIAESALRQADRITADAVILPDRLEDIAIQDSHAAEQLRQRPPFDVINIDACDHLGYCPKGRTRNTFDALGALLSHQMEARAAWMLFVTTRVEPALLGNPGIQFQRAIMENLRLAEAAPFSGALASAIEADSAKLASELTAVWGTHNARFLKLYCIGLGKFLLHFFHAQPNLPANVQLASAYAYRVYHEEPDMLALAFRIVPDPRRTFEPNVGGAAVIPDLEPRRAAYVAEQAKKLQDLDHALEVEPDVRLEAVNGTVSLLHSANYDIQEWKAWLEGHCRRPVSLEGTSALVC